MLVKLCVFSMLCCWIILNLVNFGTAQTTIDDKPIAINKQLVYSHKKHIERGYKCQSCHPGITESERADDRNLPTEAVCRVCHDGIILRNECSLCHQVLANLKPLPNPPRKITFSHKRHVLDQPDCYFCHAGVNDTHYCVGDFLPAMKICMSCHDGNKAGRSCEVCHEQTTLRQLKPEDHNEIWRHAHRSTARDHRDECFLCHDQNEMSCQNCHEGFNLGAVSHVSDYQLQHGLDARTHATDCASCHDATHFCQPCHQNSGMQTPLDHLTTAAWPQSGHAQAARNDIETCAACHNTSGSVCVNCHREGQINPHPTGYADRLGNGPWHDDPTYMCYDCHQYYDDPQFGFCRYCHDR